MGVRCKDPAIYEVTSHWRALGLENADQVRCEVLSRPSGQWDEAVSLHVNTCAYCAALARSLATLQSAAVPSGDSERVRFAVCPSAEKLALFHWKELPVAEEQRAIEEHVKKCSACQAEERWLGLTEDTTAAKTFSRRWYFPVAAALLFASILFTQHFKSKVPKAPSYADLASVPALNSADLLAASVPADRPLLENIMADYNAGRYPRAEQRSRELIATGDNPSAELLMALSMYHRGYETQAYAAMLESEHIAPMSEYRCWTLLQLALLHGDRKIIERECQHVSHHAVYGPLAAKISQQVAARQNS